MIQYLPAVESGLQGRFFLKEEPAGFLLPVPEIGDEITDKEPNMRYDSLQ